MNIITQLTNDREKKYNEVTTKIIEITNEQFLSDIEDQLPTGKGIHLIITPTGGGKTTRMMFHAHETNGEVIFPVAPIKAQQEEEIKKEKDKFRIDRKIDKHNKKNQKLKRKRKKKPETFFITSNRESKKPYQIKLKDLAPLSRTRITQIERLPWYKFSDAVKIKGGSLHVDECQILYQGGFRKDVEKLIRYIIKCSQVMPVYLYSATVNPKLLSFLNVSTITYVRKPFDRNIELIQLLTSGVIKNNTNAIAITLDAIMRKSSDENDTEFDDVPMLAFINSSAMACTVIKKLVAMGHKEEDLIFLDSTRIKKSKSEENRVYRYIIEKSKLNGCGKKLVIATNVMSEGVNIYDKIHVVSTQSDSGTVFQQQGRARGDAYHWVICGSGLDRLEIKDNELYRSTKTDGITKMYSLAERSQLKESRCDWFMKEARQAALISSKMNEEFQCGRYGIQVLAELQRLGYTVKENELILKEVQIRVSGVDMTKRKMLELIDTHDCPIFYDKDHGLIKHLQSNYVSHFYDRQLIKAIAWSKSWLAMKHLGINLEQWVVYDVVNALGRSFLMWIFADGDRCIEIQRTVEDFKREFIQALEQSKHQIKAIARDSGKGGRVSGDKLETASTNLFSAVLDRSDEYEFWSDSNKHMRITLFKLLTGFVVDNGQWSIAIRGSWCVPFKNNSERNKFNVRAKHIETSGITVQHFCESTNSTTRSIASMKTKEVKTLIDSIKF